MFNVDRRIKQPVDNNYAKSIFNPYSHVDMLLFRYLAVILMLVFCQGDFYYMESGLENVHVCRGEYTPWCVE